MPKFKKNLGVVLLGGLLAGCGGSEEPSSPPPPPPTPAAVSVGGDAAAVAPPPVAPPVGGAPAASTAAMPADAKTPNPGDVVEDFDTNLPTLQEAVYSFHGEYKKYPTSVEQLKPGFMNSIPKPQLGKKRYVINQETGQVTAE